MSLVQNPYRYAIELFRSVDDAPIGQAPMRVDWEPAVEWTRFAAIRKGRAADLELGRTASIRPLWQPASGEPSVAGFRVRLDQDSIAGPASNDFTLAYFADLAQAAAAQLVERGQLEPGERFRYRVMAFPAAAPETPEPRVAFTAETLVPPLKLLPGSLSSHRDGARPYGTLDARDLPVFMPQRVLDEAAALARDAGDREAGGILVGHLRHDAADGESFTEITALVPARHAEATLTRLKFTPEVWSDVRSAIELRRRDEIWIGWAHTHPVRLWCAACPAEKQRHCALASDFLSDHDRMLHRSVFPAAYSIALVVNDAIDGISFSLFGWRNGLLEPRGFQVKGPAPDSVLAVHQITRGDEDGACSAP